MVVLQQTLRVFRRIETQITKLVRGFNRDVPQNIVNRPVVNLARNCRNFCDFGGSTSEGVINMAQYSELNSENVKDFLDSFDTVLFDCDGVLWHGMEAESGAQDTIKKLRKLGKTPFFVTNNSTKSRKQYAEKFTKLGFEASKDEVFGTAYMAALYVKEHLNIQGKVYLMGGAGLEEEFQLHGLSYIGPGPDPLEGDIADWANIPLDPEVQAVVVGFDGHVSYMKMMRAASYLNNPNMPFIGTNTDGRLPTKTGRVIPGTGCIVNSVKTAAGREPVIVGKPSKQLVECISKRHKLDRSRTIMVGDRLDTDILMGHNCGIRTLFVSSGISSLEEVKQHQASGSPDRLKFVPTYYLPSVGVLGKLMDTAESPKKRRIETNTSGTQET
ncbi:glycerol-3-phosphate phosphatase-like [Amphiura filiformis]|uniref:glycerol-3-phosphate phosphatase-like n=1 Tax=Amphiura filiformis TaxID=82378 RepID=UPI003B21BE92